MIKVDLEICDGCGLCEKACKYRAIKLIDGKARIAPSCNSCKACFTSCGNRALIDMTYEVLRKEGEETK
ncbi:MAG: 4Fe-4S binding protein [Actinomycetota bacterium]|nr:4Fe-4S binding protein [Actinomycetota bacterium]